MIYFISLAVGLTILSAAAILIVSASQKSNQLTVTPVSMVLAFIGLIVILQSVYTGPMYNVWKKQLDGKAELAQAEWNRQIVIEEAKAKEESAKSWAQAEIIRARGSDEANKIMKQSLGGNENYLRWLWIEKMDNLNGQIIYLPSDGGMPLLEAGKR